MSNINRVVELASSQHGVFASSQLQVMGVATGSRHKLVNNSMFTKEARGLYSLNGRPESWSRSAMSAVLQAGPDALLSHESALINLELLRKDFVSIRKGSKVDFHVTLPRDSRRRLNLSVHCSIYQEELFKKIIVNSIPQVSVEIAIIESARHMPEQFCSTVIDSAILKRMTSPRKIRKVLEDLWPAPGRSKSRVQKIIAGYLDDTKCFAKTESVLETRVIRLVSAVTNLQIVSQKQVIINGNKYRIDIAIPDLRIAIEVDGFEFHRDRKTFDQDRTRQNDLVAAGWTVLRFTATQSDDEILAQITRLLCDGVLKHAEGSIKRPIATM